MLVCSTVAIAVRGTAMAALLLTVLVFLLSGCSAEIGYHEAAVHYDGLQLLERLKNDGVPQDIPADFDCEARHLAYNVSLKMQPTRAPMKEVWDALQMTTLCNRTFNPRIGEAARREKSVLPELAAVDYRVFVDASQGDDMTEDGTSAHAPFRTIHFALQHTRQHRIVMREKGGVGGAAMKVGIVLRAGVHYLNDTLNLNVEDSNTVLESYPGETAVISGGTLITPQWKPYNVSQGATMVIQDGADNVWGLVPGGPGTNTSTITFMGTFATSAECQALCEYGTCYAWTYHAKDATGWSQGCYLHSDHWWNPHVSTTDTSGYWQEGPNIYVADLSDAIVPENLRLGLFTAASAQAAAAGDFRRATRARYPNIVSEESTLFPAGWVPGSVTWQGPKDMGTPVYITLDKPTYDLNPFYANFRIGVDGPCSIFTPPESYWCSDRPGGGGARMFESPTGVTFDKISLPHGPYNPDLFTAGAVLHTWRPAHWSSWMFEFADFDPASRTGTFSRGGFQGARGEGKGAEWWLSNVFEELDHPNEYFYNPKTKQLYYFYNGTGAPPAGMQFVSANLKTMISVTGSSDEPVTNVTIQNVVITGAAYTYMDPHGVPSGGDWGLSRSGAVFAEGARQLNVRNCLFKNLDGNALFLSGMVHDGEIVGNEFTLVGESAMAAWGYTDLIDGTNQQQPRRNLVDSNFIHEIGLYEKQSSCWFQAKSAQTRLTKNICFNGPRAGVNINDGFGGANLLEDNVLFNLCRESSDHAPFNSWDRQPFLTDVLDPGAPTVYPADNNVMHNFLLCNYGSSMCLDNDDGSSYYRHSHNYLVYGGHKSNFGGHDKASISNFNIYPRVYLETCFAVFQNALNRSIADSYVNCSCVLRGDANELLYSFRQPCDLSKPDSLSFITFGNQIYAPNGPGKVSVNVCGKMMSAEDWFKLGLDPGTVINPMPSTETIIGWGKTLFGIE